MNLFYLPSLYIPIQKGKKVSVPNVELQTPQVIFLKLHREHFRLSRQKLVKVTFFMRAQGGKTLLKRCTNVLLPARTFSAVARREM